MGTSVVLGLNSAYHEDSAALLVDGRIAAFVEQERFSRRKHSKYSCIDNSDMLPFEAIEYCLKEGGARFSDLDAVCYSILPTERLVRNIQYAGGGLPVRSGDWGSPTGEIIFHRHNMNVLEKLREHYGCSVADKFFFFEHHKCHAASAFFASGFSSAAVLVVDGIGEFATAWLGHGCRKRGLKCLRTVDFPHSIGMLWDRLVEFCGFHYYDSSHLMGLAGYGKPSGFIEKLEKLLPLSDEMLFTVDNAILTFRCEARDEEFNTDGASHLQYLSDYLGLKPRKTDTELSADYMNLAYATQCVVERRLTHLAEWLREHTGEESLCLAGGVALNCVANGMIAKGSSFRKLWVQPASNDAGTALGAAYLYAHLASGGLPPGGMTHNYTGPQYDDAQIRQVLVESGLRHEKLDEDSLIGTTASLIEQGNIVAWFQGRMEVGPRALGNRSILADPRLGDVSTIINQRVKHREWFRPLCPSVLKDRVSDWFNMPENGENLAKYMLIACETREDKRSLVPAVVHVDGTARVHAVEKDINPLFHALISRFDELTGIPILLNTSFNIRGPIVCSPRDAVACFVDSDMDALCIGPFLARKE